MNLDPVEVLDHLHLLGYRTVSEKQLAEFVRDLKKLIKYDLSKKQFLLEDVEGSPEAEQSKENCFPANYSVDSGKQTHSKKFRNGDKDTCSSSITSTSSSARSLISQETINSREKGILRCAADDSVKDNARKLPIGKISHPSYIRSWHINKRHNLKNDPVARYQWYQSQWNNLKVPGEEAHSQLRWHVRERMLGEDPNPRPTSWTSGRCSRNSATNFNYHPR